MVIDTWILLADLLKEGFWHAFEHEAQDTMTELRWVASFGKIALETMDDMHLQIHEFAVN